MTFGPMFTDLHFFSEENFSREEKFRKVAPENGKVAFLLGKSDVRSKKYYPNLSPFINYDLGGR